MRQRIPRGVDDFRTAAASFSTHPPIFQPLRYHVASPLRHGSQPRDRESTPKAEPERTRLEAEIERDCKRVSRIQAHPKNHGAVKKSGTAVVSKPSLSAKPMFLATAHDEFEILNYNQDWVHVRISGLSRGWIWRNDLEMPTRFPTLRRRLQTGKPRISFT